MIDECSTERRPGRARKSVSGTESRKRLSLALAAAGMGIWEMDLRSGAVEWSDECFEIVGCDSFDGTYEAFAASVHPDDRQSVQDAIDAAVGAHESYAAEFRWLHRDGTWHWLSNSGRAEYDHDGEPIRLFGTVQDITSQRLATEDLRASERRFRQLAESIEEVFWLTNVEKTEILYVSPGYETIWGRSCASLYASPRAWLDAIHADDRSVIASAAHSQAFNGYDVEYRVVRPDGEIRWIRDRAFPVRDEQGNVVRVAGVAEDVTQRRALEAQLRHAQKMQSIGELAGGIAHDFNNILTIISTATDLLGRLLPIDEEAGEMLDEIRTAQQRATGLTRQLLAFSRRDVVEPRVVDLDAAVIDIERMLRRLLGEDVRLTTKLTSGANVRIDPGQLAQILMNLAVNARDAMPLGGHLHIETTVRAQPPIASTLPDARSGYAVITVKDSGQGMSNEAREQAFEPFFTTKTVGEGTGMGLAVVHGIVEQAGGRVDVESEVGVGTVFTIHLPAAAAAPDDAPTAPTTYRGHSEVVLLVEDEPAVRRMAEEGLRRQGYQVIAVSSGEEAIDVLSTPDTRIDLLLTDVVMPGMHGHELAGRAIALRPGLRVLYTSGYTHDEVLRRGIQESQVAFLAKPFTIATLAQSVANALPG